jgi:hypothetical protein
MPTLKRAKQDVLDLVEDIKERYHGALVAAEVTVDVLMAHPGENDDHAVKLHGYPCAAVVKITPYQQRVMGVADAIITIDAATWHGLSDAEREALIDHELHHLEVQRDKEGAVKSDDQGRPKLRMRLHDVQAGWFLDVVRRHKESSLEIKQARQVWDEFGQLLFPWAQEVVEDKSLKTRRQAREVAVEVG